MITKADASYFLIGSKCLKISSQIRRCDNIELPAKIHLPFMKYYKRILCLEVQQSQESTHKRLGSYTFVTPDGSDMFSRRLSFIFLILLPPQYRQ